MLDTSSDLMLLLDRDGTIEWASAAATRLLGHLRREVIGRPWSALVHPDDHDLFEQLRSATEADGGGRTLIDARLVDRQGEWRRFELHVTNRLDDPIIEGIIISARDVTRLRDTENLLWQAIENAQLGVLEIDANGRIVSANDALTRLVDRSADEMTGLMLGDALAPGERRQFQSELALLRSGLIEGVRTELRWPDESDDAPWLSLRVSRVSSDSSAPPRLMAFATDVTVQKRDATRSRAEHLALVRESNHDPLTGVLNRRGLMHRIRPIVQRSALSNETLALLFIDLDDFKAINDEFGHQTGDEVLAEVARHLINCIRAGDIVGRYGGDEFVVMARVGSWDEADALAHRLARQLAEPFTVGSEVRSIGASVGIALNDNTTSVETLLQEADAAMYLQKRSRQTSKGSERT
jgi:diguanylate cyclase (GGDEF)-like protein/PAS domain S-box-containing protein